MDPRGGAPGPTPGDDSPDGVASSASAPDPFAFGRAPASPPGAGAGDSPPSRRHRTTGPAGQTHARRTPSSASAKSYTTLQGTPHPPGPPTGGPPTGGPPAGGGSHVTLRGTPLPPTHTPGANRGAPSWAWLPKDGEVFAAADPGTCRPMMCDPSTMTILLGCCEHDEDCAAAICGSRGRSIDASKVNGNRTWDAPPARGRCRDLELDELSKS